MRIILIGNYPPDRQESMERFTLMLDAGFRRAGVKCEIWRPKVLFGSRFKSTNSGLGKWFGYIDKWIVFPLLLRWRLFSKSFMTPDVHFHICDHSNAPYLKNLPVERTGITCHDVLAIRGAMGFSDAYCEASSMGKILQKWILGNLSQAKLLASVSHLTINQLRELVTGKETDQREWKVIHNAFNADFSPLEIAEREVLLKQVGIAPEHSFLLHVGSGLPRKNRTLLLKMVAELKTQWTGRICFAGEAPDEMLIHEVKLLELEEQVRYIINPDHATLRALYCACEAFIFPSFSEGFGWPVIEAQACGAPVIASNIEPMPEVSGGAALHADPKNPQEFARAFLSLKDSAVRNRIIQNGLENAQRFEPKHMMDAYLNLHGFKVI